jgi:hypothetical protein
MIIVERDTRVIMPISGPSTINELGALLADIHAGGLPYHPVIMVFFTGLVTPRSCVPMLRNPAPDTGFAFDRSFASHLSHAYSVNDSVHDGAVLFRRRRPDHLYLCHGWSFRMVARGKPDKAAPNRGSAYNSAIAVSLAGGVDCVVLLLEQGFEMFVGGESFPPMA